MQFCSDISPSFSITLLILFLPTPLPKKINHFGDLSIQRKACLLQMSCNSTTATVFGYDFICSSYGTAIAVLHITDVHTKGISGLVFLVLCYMLKTMM
ncbi:hypothetical protein SEVIR_4G170126v4 [Setaria viridis]